MSEIDGAIAGWEGWLREHYPAGLASYAPGLTDVEIDRILAPLAPWRPPEAVIALYRWRNGDSQGVPLLGWNQVSLAEAVRWHRHALADPDDTTSRAEYLGLPIFSVDAPLFCELYPDRQEDGPLWVNWKGDGEVIPLFPTLSSALRVAVRALEIGPVQRSPVGVGVWVDHPRYQHLDEVTPLLAERDQDAYRTFGLDRLPDPSDVFDRSTWPRLWRDRAPALRHLASLDTQGPRQMP